MTGRLSQDCFFQDGHDYESDGHYDDTESQERRSYCEYLCENQGNCKWVNQGKVKLLHPSVRWVKCRLLNIDRLLKKKKNRSAMTFQLL